MLFLYLNYIREEDLLSIIIRMIFIPIVPFGVLKYYLKLRRCGRIIKKHGGRIRKK